MALTRFGIRAYTSTLSNGFHIGHDGIGHILRGMEYLTLRHFDQTQVTYSSPSAQNCHIFQTEYLNTVTTNINPNDAS